MKCKNIRCYLFFLLCLCSCLFVMPNTSYAQDTDALHDLIYDDAAGLITSKENEEIIRSQMKEIATECHVIFYTTDEASYDSAEEKCEAYVANLYGASKTTSAVMFLIDMDNREIYLYCTGAIHTVITNGDALTITDNVYRYASRGDYTSCAREAFREAYAVGNGYRIKRPMKTINNLLVAIFLGFIINYIVLKIRRSIYKKKFISSNSLRKNSHLKIESDWKYRRTYHYRESDGSSGGGSSGSFGGGSSSGGSSSGGSSGGGHSF